MSLRLALRNLAVELPRPRESAKGSVQARRALAVSIEGGGEKGEAEAAPLPGFSAETLEEVAAALRGLRLDGASSSIPELAPPSARFAVEAALLDREGKQKGCPVAALLGANARELRAVGLVDSIETGVEDALRMIEAGAPGVKVKIGRPGRARDEAALLFRLRAELGPSRILRADANGALGDARHPLLEVLAEIGVDYVEEPFSVERLLEAPPLPCPVALDESVDRAPSLALEAVARGKAEALVLKPTRLGVSASLSLGREVEREGGRVVVGHLFEPPRAFAMLVHLALALDPEGAHGLFPYAGLDAWTDEDGARVALPVGLGGPVADVRRAEGLG